MFDASWNIYIDDFYNQRILELGSGGTLLKSIPYTIEGRDAYIAYSDLFFGGMAINPSGNLYMVYESGTTIGYDSNGNIIGRGNFREAPAEWPEEQTWNAGDPISARFGDDGYLYLFGKYRTSESSYVPDRYQPFMKKCSEDCTPFDSVPFDIEGGWVGEDNSYETALEYYPDMDSQGNLYMVASNNQQHRIATFNQEGKSIGSIEIDADNMQYVSFDILGMDNEDNLYLACLFKGVTDASNYYDLFKYERAGKLVAHGRLFQQFGNDYGIYMDSYGLDYYPFFIAPNSSIYAYGYSKAGRDNKGEVTLYRISI